MILSVVQEQYEFVKPMIDEKWDLRRIYSDQREMEYPWHIRYDVAKKCV